MIHMTEQQLFEALHAALAAYPHDVSTDPEGAASEIAEKVYAAHAREDVIVLDSVGGEAAAVYTNGSRGFTYDYDAASDHLLRELGVKIESGDLFYPDLTSYDDIPAFLYDVKGRA